MKICPSCYATVETDARFCGLCGAELTALMTSGDRFLGQVIADKYSVECLLGHGGMGDVYLAYDRALDDRPVAVKIVNQRFRDDVTVITRFRNEARSIARIQHPNAVMLLDHGLLDDGTVYLIMEYVPGRNLADHMQQEGPLPHKLVMTLSLQLAEVLATAHQQGVVHRDLKPDNIMLSETSPGRYQLKVLDFGIAKLLDDPGARLTQAGTVFGTPEFMSPEQAQGHDVDHRTDIYSFGIILYFMLTHRLPFEGQNQLAVLNKQIREEPARPSELRPDIGINVQLESLIMGCLVKDRDQRYPSCEVLLDDLDLIVAGGQITSSREEGAPRRATVQLRETPSLELVALGSDLEGNDTQVNANTDLDGMPLATDEPVSFPSFDEDDPLGLFKNEQPAEQVPEAPARAEPSGAASTEVPAETPPEAIEAIAAQENEPSGLLSLGELEVDQAGRARQRSSGGGGAMGLILFLVLVLGVGAYAYTRYVQPGDDAPEPAPDTTGVAAGADVADAAGEADTVGEDAADGTTDGAQEQADRPPIPGALGPEVRSAALASLMLDEAQGLFEKGDFEDVGQALAAPGLKSSLLPEHLKTRAEAMGTTNDQVRTLLREGIKASRSTRRCDDAAAKLEALRPLSAVAAETLDRKVKACNNRLRNAPGALPE